MKIIVTGTRGIPGIQGGVETHCEELLPTISRLYPADKITIVRRSPYVMGNDISEYKGIKIQTLFAPHSRSLEALVHTFLAVLYASIKRPDVLHIHAVGPSLFTPFARMLGLKVVMTHHGPDYERDKWGNIAKWFLKFGERCGVTCANKVIVISAEIGQHLSDKYGRKDCVLIPNGVPAAQRNNSTDYLQQLGIESERYIFSLGRFVPEKGFDYLIRAYKKTEMSCKYRLVIAGDADLESPYSLDLKNLAEREGVILTGFIKGKKLQQLYTHARLFVLPSFYEGLPISLLEAMSYRLDILASDICANKEVHLPKASYFQTGEIDVLREKLDWKLREPMSHVDYDMNRYNWDKIATLTHVVYESLS